MSQMKNRMQALNLLDRAVSAISDPELEQLLAGLPADHTEGLDDYLGAPEGGFPSQAERVEAVRAAALKGRVNGGLEAIAAVLTDASLAKCIELLGDNADNPSSDQLREVIPALVEEFGVPVLRVMFAASVAGEAAASAILIDLLKHDDTVKLPPAEARPGSPLLAAASADDDTKARRKAAKEKKQAEAAKRRAQQQAAAHR